MFLFYRHLTEYSISFLSLQLIKLDKKYPDKLSASKKDTKTYRIDIRNLSVEISSQELEEIFSAEGKHALYIRSFTQVIFVSK